MFPNGNVGLENSKFYEDVPARGHLIGRAATGSCPKSTLVMPAPAGTICVGESLTKRRRQTMKSILCLSLLILLMPSAYAAELPGDSAEGSFLHDANCLGCHDTGVYTRKDRRIRSLDALKGQLANCSHMATLQFSAIETQNIIKYLNDQFYQFP
jgi:hypothetical protein